jgi:hypothetical protein
MIINTCHYCRITTARPKTVRITVSNGFHTMPIGIEVLYVCGWLLQGLVHSFCSWPLSLSHFC